MKFTQLVTASMAVVGSVFAAPQKKSITDADVLNYALTLEHLENAFYKEGLSKLSANDFAAAGYGADVYNNLLEVLYDESTHVAFLSAALSAAGATPVKPCTYNFGITGVTNFLATASVLEGVGVTAYIGAAGYIASKEYLTAAGTILTVEARHSAYLRAAGLKQSPFPQAFDVPLTFNEVYSLAAPFIVSCPKDNPSFLTLKAFPAVKVVSTGEVRTGTTIQVTYEQAKSKRGVNVSVNTGKKAAAPAQKGKSNAPCYAAFVTVTGPVWAQVSANADGSLAITVPAGVHGQSYLVLTKSGESASDDNIIAGPAIVEIAGTDAFP